VSFYCDRDPIILSTETVNRLKLKMLSEADPVDDRINEAYVKGVEILSTVVRTNKPQLTIRHETKAVSHLCQSSAGG
jgi:hypothetical protein